MAQGGAPASRGGEDSQIHEEGRWPMIVAHKVGHERIEHIGVQMVVCRQLR